MLLTYIAPPEAKVRHFDLTLVVTALELTLLFLFPGLNLGICDAIELAKTISSHNKSRDNQLLFSYSTTRRARAVQVIELSSSGLSIFDQIRNSAFIRRWIVGFIFNRIAFIKSRIIWRLSGLGTNTIAAK